MIIQVKLCPPHDVYYTSLCRARVLADPSRVVVPDLGRPVAMLHPHQMWVDGTEALGLVRTQEAIAIASGGQCADLP